jgi:hypothetical protein
MYYIKDIQNCQALLIALILAQFPLCSRAKGLAPLFASRGATRGEAGKKNKPTTYPKLPLAEMAKAV